MAFAGYLAIKQEVVLLVLLFHGDRRVKAKTTTDKQQTKARTTTQKQQTKARTTTTENSRQQHYSREWLVPPVLPPYPLTAVFHEDNQGVGRSRLKVQASPGPHNATASKQGTLRVHRDGTRNDIM